MENSNGGLLKMLFGGTLKVTWMLYIPTLVLQVKAHNNGIWNTYKFTDKGFNTEQQFERGNKMTFSKSGQICLHKYSGNSS